MAHEHRIDLADGTDEHVESDRQDLRIKPDPSVLEAQKRKDDALARLQSAAQDDGNLRDLLTLLGYQP